MRQRLISHLHHNVVGYLALVVALSGTAYAASEVGGRDLGPIVQRQNEIVLQPGQTDSVIRKCRRGERALGLDAITSPGTRAVGWSLLYRDRKRTVGGILTGENTGSTPARFGIGVACLKR